MSLSTLRLHRQTSELFDSATTTSSAAVAAENTDLLVLKSKWLVDVVHNVLRNARIHCITFYSICSRNCAHELAECRTEINVDTETNHTETIELLLVVDDHHDYQDDSLVEEPPP